ncbi:MAG: Gfo/Idh/MocA family oxidoreductase [Deltaproteobacteria bacterium]|nr:Gfo/Idh/MocA family oxidoreductase [Deltaproteobacteria bacterium]
MAAERVRIGIVGIGWIGAEVARASLEDPRVELVGVADSDPAKANHDLGAVIGEGRIGLAVDPSAEALVSRARPEVVVVSTTSDATLASEVARTCLSAGCHVVLTTESLAEPGAAVLENAESLDATARARGVAVLATGVNPGFAMDRLPVTLGQMTRAIRRVRVRRVVELRARRAQLQAKAGVGMTRAEFRRAMEQNRVGHVGLDASVRLIARGLDLPLEAVSERIEPLVAEVELAPSVLGPVKKGRVRGVRQVARGHSEGQELITLELIMALDEPDPFTVVDLVGQPPIHFEGQLPGDACTVAAVLSAVGLVVDLEPGLRSVLDLPAARPHALVQAPSDDRPRLSIPVTKAASVEADRTMETTLAPTRVAAPTDTVTRTSVTPRPRSATRPKPSAKPPRARPKRKAAKSAKGPRRSTKRTE